MASEESQSTPFSAESYFATQPPPPTLDEDVARVRDFVQRQQKDGRKVVLVTVRGRRLARRRVGLIRRAEWRNDRAAGAQRVSTPGGLAAAIHPLMRVHLQCSLLGQLQCRCVPAIIGYRLFLIYLAVPGTRGATSAEYFLEAGYAVIFMHRQFSLQPFSRHYSHSTHPFLDFLDVDDSKVIDVKSTERPQLIEVLTAYKRVHTAGTLHTLTFVTVNDYLWLLRAVSQELVSLGRHAMFYLAAAVSDFFLPRQKMVRFILYRRALSFHADADLTTKVRAQDSIGQGKPAH